MMRIEEFFKQAQTRVGSVFSRKPDLESQIRRIAQELEQIEEIRRLTEWAGWKHISAELQSLIQGFKEEIASKCGDIDKNRTDIQAAYALKVCYETFLGVVESKLAREEGLKQEFKEKLEFFDNNREGVSLQDISQTEG